MTDYVETAFIVKPWAVQRIRRLKERDVRLQTRIVRLQYLMPHASWQLPDESTRASSLFLVEPSDFASFFGLGVSLL